jgi:hypothetical protein
LTTWVTVGLTTSRAHAQLRGNADVVVIRHPGVPAYQEIFDEFSERCRLSTRVLPVETVGDITLDEQIGTARVLVTLGQDALDATSRRPEQKIAMLAAYPTDRVITAPTTGTPAEILRALRIAMPSVQTIGVLAGPRQDAWLQRVTDTAKRSNLTLVVERPTDGPSAVRALRKIANRVDAVWLPADPDVVSVQVFRYALQLQQERQLPLIAATRQQVHSGALLAVDYAPRALGRAAADVINRWVEHPLQEPVFPTLSSTITVNRRAAHRLAADMPALVAIGARLE